jgi:hypothetical protein
MKCSHCKRDLAGQPYTESTSRVCRWTEGCFSVTKVYCEDCRTKELRKLRKRAHVELPQPRSTY